MKKLFAVLFGISLFGVAHAAYTTYSEAITQSHQKIKAKDYVAAEKMRRNH